MYNGITIGDVARATGGEIISGQESALIKRVVHDSRSAAAGDLFVALIGERHDAHSFIEDVVEAGCSSVLVSHMDWAGGLINGVALSQLNIVKVADTRRALQDLASWYIRKIGVKVIGVTGSTGKTSTKDMTYYVCSTKYKTGRTSGNFNNDIGLPLTVLGFDEDTEVAVLEMGMDHFGEIDLLAGLVRPQIGLISNIGVSHMENLGSREGIMKAKMEITDYFTAEDTLIISTGKDLLRRENISGDYHLLTTGEEEDDDYRVSDIENVNDGLSFTLTHGGEEQRFYLPVPGRHNAFNAALAVAAGGLLGISMSEAAAGLKEMELSAGRLSLKHSGGLLVIDDTYNASPDSVKGALDVLDSTAPETKIAILGDMYELGENTLEMHRQTGEYAAASSAQKVIAIGENARYIALGAGDKGIYFADKKGFLNKMDELVPDEAAVLVKGSRGMKMEEIVAALAGRGEKK
ncbi:MAG: UDP-N-acetylmuramoyl-tripeptide--D-alanyl-D-alanine ligase [Anaerovoracaceae bacterium]|jgi:UDP-N-acetylmuramoyl-tripeptide--D-alanyl-D-alanine ligase